MVQLDLLSLKPIEQNIPLTIGYSPLPTLNWEQALDALIALGQSVKQQRQK